MPTRDELRQLQALPLEVKVAKTKQRIREWVRHYGTDGVYISFSGGKDSTVLLHLVREMYPDIPAVFCDTGLEFPEIRDFVKTFDNVVWLKPKMNFRRVIDKYGYPFISKEISKTIGWGQATLKILEKDGIDISDRDVVINECASRAKKTKGAWMTLAKCYGAVTKDKVVKTDIQKEEKYEVFDIPEKYRCLLTAPFKVSSACCEQMKKRIAHSYAKETGRVAITAQMAEESRLRAEQWMRSGCNAFDNKYAVSNPMAFWKEQDVLHYIKYNDIQICSVYGDIVYEADGLEYATSLIETSRLKTTGKHRTGCMFCGYGCHLEKGEGRFEMMKRTHPKQYEYIMKPWDKGGLGYKEVIDWINENCGTDIKY